MLAVIMAYFDPFQSPYRLENFRHASWHIRKSGVPLYVTELVFGDAEFQIGAGEADYIYRLRAKDVMFQKERMLNYALERLPPEINNVVWMDADIVYLLPSWPERVEKALERYKVVQPFSFCVALPKCKTCRYGETTLAFFNTSEAGNIRNSFAYHMNHTNWFVDLHQGHTGYVWAARREFLDRHKLYDRTITGAGDLMMVLAFADAFGWLDHLKEFKALNDAAVVDFFDWGFPVWEEVRREVGYTEDLIMHLWHGEGSRRDYLHKSAALQINNFDPKQDIAVDENGCWKWNSNKPRLHQALVEVFQSQQEC